MEHGSIEQSIFIDAKPETVYEVVSTPEHLAGWYVDEADFETAPGNAGRLVFGGPAHRREVPITVVDAVPGVRFSFYWTAPPAPLLLPVGTPLTAQNALLVTFSLKAKDGGTLLTVSETGMRELGWEAAVLERYYNDHTDGWLTLFERLASYLGTSAFRR